MFIRNARTDNIILSFGDKRSMFQLVFFGEPCVFFVSEISLFIVYLIFSSNARNNKNFLKICSHILSIPRSLYILMYSTFVKALQVYNDIC